MIEGGHAVRPHLIGHDEKDIQGSIGHCCVSELSDILKQSPNNFDILVVRDYATNLNVNIQESIPEYLGSEHFFLLDDGLKPHAEPLLTFWGGQVGNDLSNQTVLDSLQHVARLDVAVSGRRSFPALLIHFLEYLADSGKVPTADSYADLVRAAEPKYVAAIRQDGTVRGETVRNRHAAVGRNDPCPCGSGKKFKRCCGR